MFCLGTETSVQESEDDEAELLLELFDNDTATLTFRRAASESDDELLLDEDDELLLELFADDTASLTFRR